jgi:hypothetical protein
MKVKCKNMNSFIIKMKPLDEQTPQRIFTDTYSDFTLQVGFFGYVAFCDSTIGGDIITQFSETFVVDIIQILFVLSIVVTFPLIIYPCRGSFYTLLFAQVGFSWIFKMKEKVFNYILCLMHC